MNGIPGCRPRRQLAGRDLVLLFVIPSIDQLRFVQMDLIAWNFISGASFGCECRLFSLRWDRDTRRPAGCFGIFLFHGKRS